MSTQLQTTTRRAEVHRQTKETDVRVALTLDGTGQAQIATGVGFLDHMLTLFAKHGLFDLEVVCRGDLQIDDHHSVEDIAITMGQALSEALGDKAGIARYGSAIVPMDEALCRAVIDLSGRFHLVYEVKASRNRVGAFSVEMAEHFWRSFAEAARCNLHIDLLRGRNTHHILEATFKATARALRQAVERDARIQGVLSTKGVL
ncbi:MAG: imidazoleglycerol-phosphate dehydratase HisB [Pyrinomonadaceae bacterium]|nr:imidazoleglycerol-phosphate dehydratase HisB [Pyrinomonadaceae bacterium]